MAFVPAPDTAKVEIRYLLTGQQIENVMNFRHTGGYDAGLLEELADAVRGMVESEWLPLMSDDLTFLEVKATDISVEGGESVTAFPSEPSGGALTGSRLPNESSIAIRFKASTGGRNGSGRLFWPTINVSQTDAANTMSPTSLADIIAAIQALVDALNVLGHIFVIVSRYLNNAARTTAVDYQVVSINAFDRTLDSQRRRKPGIGS